MTRGVAMEMSSLLFVGSFFLGGHKRPFPQCIGQLPLGGVPVPDQNLDYLEQQRDIVIMEEFQRLEKVTSSFIFDNKLQLGGRHFINCRHSLTQEKITDRDGERFAYLYQDLQRRELFPPLYLSYVGIIQTSPALGREFFLGRSLLQPQSPQTFPDLNFQASLLAAFWMRCHCVFLSH